MFLNKNQRFLFAYTVLLCRSSWSSFVMLSNPHPLKLQNRYVCPDGIFPGPLLASGRPKESHFSSHFIGPYHLHLSSKVQQFGWMGKYMIMSCIQKDLNLKCLLTYEVTFSVCISQICSIYFCIIFMQVSIHSTYIYVWQCHHLGTIL